MTYHSGTPVRDPWTAQRQKQYRAALSRVTAASGFGQTPAESPAVNPPPITSDSTAIKVGWAAVTLLTIGLFYFTVNPPSVMQNRRRRVRRNLFGGSGRYKITTTGGRTLKSVDSYGYAHAESIALDRGEPVELIDTKTGKSQTVGGHALEPNRLSASRRSRMPRTSFVFPERRAWPIDTPERAYAAIQMLRMGRVSTAGDYRKITRAIRHRYPKVWSIYGKKLAWSRVKRAKGRRASHPRRRRSSSRMAANGKRRRVSRNASLHERVAQALGWTPDQARGFSLAALRDLVRPVDPRLAEEISDQIRGGPHVFGRPLRLPPGALTGGMKRNMGWDTENVQQMLQQLQRVLGGQVGSDAEEVQIVDDAHEFASELKRRSGKVAKGSAPQRRMRQWARDIEALAQQAESAWRPA